MTSEYIDKQGFTKVIISSQAAMETHASESFRQDGVYAYASLIPYDHKTATRVHFVSGTNGAEYGQFATKELANEHARIIADMPTAEREEYEQ